MKNLRYILTSMFLVLSVSGLIAQGTNNKKQAKAEAVKKLLDSKNFVFIAQYANPMHGGHRYLNYDYDFRVKPDSLIAYLPYFGRVNFDPPVYPTDGGIKFTSTKFGYEVKPRKNGSVDISLTPQDAKYNRQLWLTVQTNGYATLNVNITNADPISFDGYIDAPKAKK